MKCHMVDFCPPVGSNIVQLVEELPHVDNDFSILHVYIIKQGSKDSEISLKTMTPKGLVLLETY